MKRTLSLFLFSAALWLTGCYTVPETGRRALAIIPAEQEIALGAQSFAEMRRNEPLSNDPRLNARVQQVGARIAQAVGDDLPNAKWEFAVFESEDVNAFALPGGKVGVYTGLLRLAETDDELATVIGHEIAHVTARHGNERMSEALLLAGGAALTGIVADRHMDTDKRNALLAAYGVVATTGVVLPHSRRAESEADLIGLRYSARAGYDPRAAITFWQKMADMKQAKGGAKMPAFLSTHPSDQQRIAALRKQVPQVMPIYEQARGVRAPIGTEIGAPEIGSPEIGREIGR